MFCTGILRHIDRSNMLTRTSWQYIEPQYALLWTYSTTNIARFCLKNIRLAVCIAPSRPRVLKFPIYIAAQLCNILNETYRIVQDVQKSFERPVGEINDGHLCG